MKDLDAKIAHANAKEAERQKELDRLAQQVAAVFSTPDGKEIFTHLADRFGFLERTFTPGHDTREPNALRAALRDGERAVVAYLYHLAGRAGKALPLPPPKK